MKLYYSRLKFRKPEYAIIGDKWDYNYHEGKFDFNMLNSKKMDRSKGTKLYFFNL